VDDLSQVEGRFEERLLASEERARAKDAEYAHATSKHGDDMAHALATMDVRPPPSLSRLVFGLACRDDGTEPVHSAALALARGCSHIHTYTQPYAASSPVVGY
jgi:hypothetical protein